MNEDGNAKEGKNEIGVEKNCWRWKRPALVAIGAWRPVTQLRFGFGGSCGRGRECTLDANAEQSDMLCGAARTV